MTAADAQTVVSALRHAGVDFWVTGGWGVDALVGRQTRDHQDLDLVIPDHALDTALEVATRLGFETAVDWLPARVALRDQHGSEIDIHPIVFEDDGDAWLPDLDGGRFEFPAGDFTEGVLAGESVPCISAALQLAFHLGYEATDKDRHDMAALAAAELTTPDDAAELS